MMKTGKLLLLAALTAVASLPVYASSSDTDQIRAEVAKREAAANREASLRPFSTSLETVVVTDTDSARLAAALANARQAHDAYYAEILRVGAGILPEPIKVTDTDSARAAAAQAGHQRGLRTDYAEYAKTSGKS